MSKYVITPTGRWLKEHARGCKDRFLVSSPYIGSFLPKLTARMHSSVQKSLLTRADLRDFAAGASDLEAVCDLARQGASIQSVPGLHAKAYVFDNRYALVTSANATNGGMHRNWECGVTIDDAARVDELAQLLASGFHAPQAPEMWTLADLESLRLPVRVIKKRLEPLRHLSDVDSARVVAIKLSRAAKKDLLSGFSGWLKLTLEAVLSQPDDTFSLNEIFATCKPLISARFPGNRHPRPKVRQQLQRLRDLGLVGFLGSARYRRTLHS